MNRRNSSQPQTCKGPRRHSGKKAIVPVDIESQEEPPVEEEEIKKKPETTDKGVAPLKKGQIKKKERKWVCCSCCSCCSLTCQDACKDTYHRFCRNCSIDGVQYFNIGHGRIVRLLWYLFVLLAFLLFLFTLWYIVSRWLKMRTIVIYFPNLYQIGKLPLPAFTICSEAKTTEFVRGNYSNFLEYCKGQENKTISRPPDLSDDQFQNMRVLLQICRFPPTWQFEEFPKDNISFEYSINQMFVPFEEQFKHCHFNQTSGTCNYFFEKVYTDAGLCYKFNALDDKEIYRDDTYQYKYCLIDEHIKYRDMGLNWRIDKGFEDTKLPWSYPERAIGSEMGFFAAMEQKLEFLDPNCRAELPGFKLIFHSPDDVPLLDKHFVAIRYNYGAIISVLPHFIYASDDIDAYEPEDRDCYYPEERWLRFFRYYTQNNCELECLANYTLNRCGCVKFSMPRLSYTTVCDASKIRCYNKAKVEFFTTHRNNECNCIPGCFHLEYDLELNMGILNSEQFTAHDDRIYFNITNETIVTKLYMAYRGDYFKAWHRMQLVSTVDFLASLGSLLRLFLGASILSFLELLYYFTFRLSERMRRR